MARLSTPRVRRSRRIRACVRDRWCTRIATWPWRFPYPSPSTYCIGTKIFWWSTSRTSSRRCRAGDMSPRQRWYVCAGRWICRNWHPRIAWTGSPRGCCCSPCAARSDPRINHSLHSGRSSRSMRPWPPSIPEWRCRSRCGAGSSSGAASFRRSRSRGRRTPRPISSWSITMVRQADIA